MLIFRYVALLPDSSGTIVYGSQLSERDMVRRVTQVLNLKQPLRHVFPLCCLRPWPMSGDCEFFLKCRHGVSQYVVWRILASFLVFCMQFAGWYEEGNFSPSGVYLYISLVFWTSQCWALYCLVLLYQALKEELSEMKPLAKFICVKSVVFFSWYQSFFLGLAVYFEWIDKKDEHGHDNATNIQNFLICIEMFIAALVHHYVFASSSDFLLVGAEPESQPIRKSWGSGLRAMFYVKDIADDAKGVTDDLHRSLLAQAKATTQAAQAARAPRSKRDVRAVDVI
eukprot:c4780_g1_i1.p1 GENE.c4780_g1_i1~~c4780_g1_i1.p1  ORF type:complete len:282 (+),score=46.21 c4780_g1_i1:449-1294(+)